MNGDAFIEYVNPLHKISVPGYIARCPECGGDLEVEIIEYTADDKRVTVDGFYVECTDEFDDEVACHNHEQHMWERVQDRVHEWLYESVRLVDDKTIFDIRALLDSQKGSPK